MADTTITFPATGGLLLGGDIEFSMPIAEVRLEGAFTTTPFLYICDSFNDRIQVFDYEGNFLFKWGTSGIGNGQFSNPYGVATNGVHVYVTDTGNNRVQIFDLDGHYISQFGSSGTEPNQFINPKGIATNGRLLIVVDQGNNRFQIFDMAGNLLMSLGEFGSGKDQFNDPTNVSMDCFFIYIDDTGNNRTVAYEMTYPFGSIIQANVPMRTVVLSANVGSIASISTTVPMRKANFSVSAPLTIEIYATVPMKQFNGEIVVGSVISMLATVPMRTVSFSTLENISVIITATVPMRHANFGVVFKTTSSGFAIVVNTVNHAVTEYESYNFESIGYVGDDIIGIGIDGNIYILEGYTDNGTNISATIQTGDVDFAAGEFKGRYRPREAWVHYESRGTGSLTLGITQDQKDTYTLPVPDPADDSYPTRKRVPFGQGLNGQVYSFTFKNVDGQDFKIFDTEILADPITRRA